VKGFCPSFVTIEGGTPKKSAAARQAVPAQLEALPEATIAELKQAPYNILITGIGGTGRHHDRCLARHGCAPGRQGDLRAGHDRDVAEERRRYVSCAHRAHAGGHSRPAHRNRRRRT
jgi:hypothetical protein